MACPAQCAPTARDLPRILDMLTKLAKELN